MNEQLDNESNINPDDHEKLMKYLRGTLSPEEESVFIEKLKTNPELKAHAVSVAHLISGLEVEGSDRDVTLAKSIKDADRSMIEKQTKIRNIMVWCARAAIFVGLVLLLVLYNRNSETQQLADEYQNTFPISEIFRGGNDDVTEINTLFTNVLNDNDLKNTITHLSDCFEQSLQPNFNQYTTYMPQIGWYLAIAHLKNNDKPAAKSTLKTLINNTEPEMLVHKKAEELLSKL